MPSNPSRIVAAPAAITPHALALSAPGETARYIGETTPLPVRPRMTASLATPLTGTLSESGTVGLFVPELGRAIWIGLSGDWTGSAQLLRSTDGGTTRLPLTVGGMPWASFTANANEAIGEESDAAATYWRSASLTAGTLTYRVAQ